MSGQIRFPNYNLPYCIPFLLLHSLPNTLGSSASLTVIKAHLQSYPTPISINFLWNVGFFLGITFGVQIVTGLYLAFWLIINISN